MPMTIYRLLDKQMTGNDEVFFKDLGKRVALLRKGLGWNQTKLGSILGISQQSVADYEAGARKIPASMLPTLAELFAVSLDELLGLTEKPVKRGPVSILQRQMEQIQLMPRAKQKIITEMLEGLIQQKETA